MKSLLLFILLFPSIPFAQKKGVGVSVFHNTLYDSELFTDNNFVISKIRAGNPSIMVGVNCTSCGKHKPFSIRHGIDIFIPLAPPILLFTHLVILIHC